MKEGTSTGASAAGGDPAERFESIVAQTSDAILVVDADGKVRFVNPAAVRLFGRPPEALLDGFRFPAIAEEETEIDVVRPGADPRVAEMRVVEIEWEGQTAYLATLRDVTERHEAEQSLRDFVSMVSHELRTPITTIRGFVDLLRGDLRDLSDEDVLHYLRTIDQQVERMGRMTGDLLTVSRIDGERVEPDRSVVDLARLLRVTADEYAGEGHGVRIVADEGVVAWADPDHVRQIVVNYLTNAMKYGEPPISFEAEDVGDGVVIRVRDEGPGVPPVFRPRLFERFSRADEGGTPGTGLGLAIVRGLAEVEGGAAWFEPNDPRGSCFCVRLLRPPADVLAER